MFVTYVYNAKYKYFILHTICMTAIEKLCYIHVSLQQGYNSPFYFYI